MDPDLSRALPDFFRDTALTRFECPGGPLENLESYRELKAMWETLRAPPEPL